MSWQASRGLSEQRDRRNRDASSRAPVNHAMVGEARLPRHEEHAMADPNPEPPDLLTLQTLHLCGVAYMADIDDPARIASGTLDGLAIIQGLTANGQTLGQFLTTFLAQPANTNVTTIVTGHSLGGCLATIVATWMRVLLPKYRGAIQPVTF